MNGPALTRRWQLPETPDVSHLPTSIPVAIARVLAGRGLDTTQKLEGFLNQSHLPHDPFLIPGMTEAVERLRKAVQAGERVGVFGDFDVDGITGTAIMSEGLESLGAEPVPYIPQRDGEGHGLSRQAIDSLAGSGATLIVTVDCGITDSAEVDYATSRGVDVVITDHHVPPEGLPKAVACVNAKLPGSQYPFSELCGAGLALKVVDGLHRSWQVPYDPALLELAALGSVADLVPLLDENRFLVSEGVSRLTRTKRPGMLALFETARLSPDELTSERISFQVAPRLNAAGRMGDPQDSYRLLTTRSSAEGSALAEKLEHLNQQRRSVTEEATELAIAKVDKITELPPLIIVADESIPQGVAGLVASRLVDRYARPSVVLSVNGNQAVASARSVPEFNIIECISTASDLLVRYGGHSQAAGFTIATDTLDAVAERLIAHANRNVAHLDLEPKLEIDAVASLPEITMEAYDYLNGLEPYGKGNRRPLFASLGVAVTEARKMGHLQQHLKLRVEQNGKEMVALAFNRAEEWTALGGQAGMTFLDLAYTLMLDSWQGHDSLALRVSHLRRSQTSH